MIGWVAIVAVGASGLAQADPKETVALYDRAIATGSVADMARAFQPSAMMYCTDGQTVTGTYQAQWKGRLAAVPPPANVTTSVDWQDLGAKTALVRATAIRGAKTFTDYILLAKLSGKWRIVGKICQADAKTSGDGADPVGAVIDTKLASDRAWDADLLRDSIDERALVMTVEGDEFVAASVAEWQARYIERKRSSSGNAVVEVDRVTDRRGDIGVARWSFRSPTGGIWTDRALVMKTAKGWRMMALIFTEEPAS